MHRTWPDLSEDLFRHQVDPSVLRPQVNLPLQPGGLPHDDAPHARVVVMPAAAARRAGRARAGGRPARRSCCRTRAFTVVRRARHSRRPARRDGRTTPAAAACSARCGGRPVVSRLSPRRTAGLVAVSRRGGGCGWLRWWRRRLRPSRRGPAPLGTTTALFPPCFSSLSPFRS